jgi:hypothetical protein
MIWTFLDPSGSFARREEAGLKAFLQHHVILLVQLSVGKKAGVIAFLNHPVGDLDIPLILLAQEAGVMAILHHHVGNLDILWYCWLNCPIG